MFQTRRSKFFFCAVFVAGTLLATWSPAATTTYEYDALGRLIVVTHDNDNVTTYDYDPAGNRREVTESSAQAAPASISVPSTSLTGSYTISWTAGGTVSSYELYESTTSNFASSTRVFTGTGTSASISGHGNGTYYYRVRGCSGSACTAYRTGSNGVVVTVPPGVPGSLSLPTPNPNITGSYSITWTVASGTLTGYQLYESTNSNFSGETSVYSGTALTKSFTGKTSGTYYYRVRACNGAACSSPRAGSGGLAVIIAPATPASITYPGSSNTGAYTVSWPVPSGTVTAYELYESVNSSFSPQALVHNNTATSVNVSGKGNGSYYYRVRACNVTQCSSYRPGSAVVVTLPPGTPGALVVPSTNNTGSYSISWGTASGTLTAYELWEANNSSFTGETRVYNSTGTSTTLSGKGNGSYYYRLRACNVTSCSAYASGGNQVVVTLPPSTPASITVPTSTAGSSFTISWGASTGTLTSYKLYESTSSSFSSQTLVYDGTGTSTSITGRTSNTYYYRVRGCNTNVCSGYRTGGNGILVDRILPSAPGTPSFTVSGTNVTATYAAATDNVGVTGYQYRLNGAASWNLAGNGSTNLTGLTHNTTYTFEVRALDGVGNAGPGASGTFTAGPPIPGMPTGLAFNQIADCAWASSWSATTHATSYRFSDTQLNESTVTGTSKTVNCPVGNPQGNKPMWVKACNATGCGAPATFGAPVDVTPPSTPGTPQFSNVTSNSATVAWDPSFDFSGIANYQYNIGSGWQTIGSTPNVSLTGLNPSSSYTFQVRAKDNANLTGSASSASFNTPAAPDTTAPSAPGAITMGTVTASTAPASWSHATDNVGVTGYEYRLNGASTWTDLGYVTSANIGVSGGTNYTLQIRARDGAGNRGIAVSKTFSTPPPIPDKPDGLKRWNPAPEAWYAKWNPVEGATSYLFMDNAGHNDEQPGTDVNYQCTPGDCPHNKPKWVKACNVSGCSGKADFAP